MHGVFLQKEPKDNPESPHAACCLDVHYKALFHPYFLHCSLLDFWLLFLLFGVQGALKAHVLTTELYLMIFRVFSINLIPIAVEAIFMQEWTSQTEWVQRKHCYSLVPCIPSWCSLTARNVVFFLPRSGFVNIFLCATLLHFHLLSLPRTILICHCTYNSGSSQIGLWTIMS